VQTVDIKDNNVEKWFKSIQKALIHHLKTGTYHIY